MKHTTEMTCYPSCRTSLVSVALLLWVLLLLDACTVHSGDVRMKRLSDSTVYTGQLVDGRPEGWGVLMQGDSVVYEGQWANGLRQGKGRAADSIGRRIEGYWKADTLVSGKRTDAGGVYVGMFDRQQRASGHGAYIDSLQRYYEGHWERDKRNGFGFSSESRYFRVGEWKNNVYKGERLNYTSERIYGIDISKHQHVIGKHRYGIDWDRLRISHLGSLSKKNVSGKVDYKVSFIFIKSTEGRTVRNPYYAGDYEAARAHGFPVGSYHFFTTSSTGAQQAAHFLRHSHFRKGDLPPVLDLEPTSKMIRKMGGTAALFREVRVWLRTVERRVGIRPILYISQIFVNRYLPSAPDLKENYPVWIARYGEYKPDVKLWIWQLAPDGRVRGIHGTVDINVFNGYQTEFQQFLDKERIK